MRIVDRIEAMEAAKSAPAAPADSDAPERDGMEAEHDRLAEAYAAGARVLGQQGLEPPLHAADYVCRPTGRRGAARRSVEPRPSRPSPMSAATARRRSRRARSCAPPPCAPS